MADVKIPGIGPVNKKVLIGVGVAAVLVGGIAWYRSRNAANSVSSSGSIDPATGFAYGSTEDTNALASDESIDPSTGYPYGSAQDTTALGSGGGGGGSAQSTGYTDNPSWSQAAETYLTGTVGLSASDVSAALGAYLTGQPVTSAQMSIIQQAIASNGLPPIGGVAGYPPGIQQVPDTTGANNGSGIAGTTGTGGNSGTTGSTGSTGTTGTGGNSGTTVAPIAPRPGAETTATMTDKYTVAQTASGTAYDVTDVGTIHQLTPAQLQRDINAGATVVTAPAPIAPRKGAETTATMTNQYHIVHDVTTGKSYDVTASGTVHELTEAQLARDIAAGASIVSSSKKPIASVKKK